MSDFAIRLKELRTERKLSQVQLADKTELGKTSIYQWENDLRIPNANAIIALAKFFGVSSDYLLGLED